MLYVLKMPLNWASHFARWAYFDREPTENLMSTILYCHSGMLKNVRQQHIESPLLFPLDFSFSESFGYLSPPYLPENSERKDRLLQRSKDSIYCM